MLGRRCFFCLLPLVSLSDTAARFVLFLTLTRKKNLHPLFGKGSSTLLIRWIWSLSQVNKRATIQMRRRRRTRPEETPPAILLPEREADKHRKEREEGSRALQVLERDLGGEVAMSSVGIACACTLANSCLHAASHDDPSI